MRKPMLSGRSPLHLFARFVLQFFLARSQQTLLFGTKNDRMFQQTLDPFVKSLRIRKRAYSYSSTVEKTTSEIAFGLFLLAILMLFLAYQSPFFLATKKALPSVKRGGLSAT
jgi:hypothetical protein